MFIRPMSDLHLEFDNPFVIPHLETDSESILILAGDIAPGLGAVDWIKTQSERFKHVVYIPGNHEFFHNDLDSLPNKLKKSFNGTNISFLNNETVIIDGIKFIGSTLWTDFDNKNPLMMRLATSAMYDYKMIKDSSNSFIKPERILDEHLIAIKFLNQELSIDEKKIVITQHGPSIYSVHPKFDNSRINPLFYSNLENMIYEHQPMFWFHGHTHERMDYDLYNTRVIVNPFGYWKHESQEKFEPKLLIEVK